MRKRHRTTIPPRQPHKHTTTPLVQQQPYDNLMKSLFEGNEQQAIGVFLPGAQYLETLTIEAIRTPLRVDRTYRIHYQGNNYILHIEFESGSNPRMGARLLNYHAYLHYKYDLPVLSIIIYLFPTSIVQSPYHEIGGEREIVTFHFHTIALWKEDASKYLQQHVVGMYPLLPTMANVDKGLLSQALEEMVQYYQDDETKLGEQLRWLGVLLRRSDTVAIDDKEAIQEEMSVLDKLLEEDPYLQKKIAAGITKGIAKALPELEAQLEAQLEKKLRAKIQAELRAKAEAEARTAKAQAEAEARTAKAQAEAEARTAKAQAEAEARTAQAAIASLQEAALHIVEVRFPQLQSLAQKKLPVIKDAKSLGLLTTQLALAPNEETARWLLETLQI
jgi:hypothetical protein